MSELLKQVKKGVDSASYNQAFEEVVGFLFKFGTNKWNFNDFRKEDKLSLD